MVDIKDIYWLAGLLEGEGCFGAYKKSKSPYIQLWMTDLDVVEKAYRILGATCSLHHLNRRDHPEYKTAHYFKVVGSKAAGWMMTLYSLMGERRQNKIKECLEIWQSYSHKVRDLGVPAKLDGKANPEYTKLYYHLVDKPNRLAAKAA